MQFYQIFNVFLMILNIVASIHVFYEPKRHNPYKYIKVILYLATAGCFAILTAPINKPFILPMCVVGFGLILLTQYLDGKDIGYSIDRVFDKSKLEKLRKKHERNRRDDHD